METHRKENVSGEVFSFPNTPIHDQDSDFEFGSITPDSPSINDPFKTSPADHIFLNGRLLPHNFPFQPSNLLLIDSTGNSSTTSRTSSISSKDVSLKSSRSNSTNSSCSSARTSSSDNSERKLLYHRKGNNYKGEVSAHVYGASQRWQFIATVPVTGLSRENSSRKKVDGNGGKKELKRKEVKKQTQKKRRSWFCFRIFRWIVLVCKECHALEPSRKDDLLKGNVKL